MKNRKLKFRAWIKHHEAMITQADFYDCIMVSNGDGFGIVEDSNWLKQDQFEIMQFTGLLDKNGVEIYEGDICTKMISPDENNLAPKELHKGEIVFHYGGFCYKSGNHYYPMSRTHGVINIIGNIHQNPELL